VSLYQVAMNLSLFPKTAPEACIQATPEPLAFPSLKPIPSDPVRTVYTQDFRQLRLLLPQLKSHSRQPNRSLRRGRCNPLIRRRRKRILSRSLDLDRSSPRLHSGNRIPPPSQPRSRLRIYRRHRYSPTSLLLLLVQRYAWWCG
jgi:hypothetical protein